MQINTTPDIEASGEQLANVLIQSGRYAAIDILLSALTSLGVVVFYYDDTDARRRDPSLVQDTPYPEQK